MNNQIKELEQINKLTNTSEIPNIQLEQERKDIDPLNYNTSTQNQQLPKIPKENEVTSQSKTPISLDEKSEQSISKNSNFKQVNISTGSKILSKYKDIYVPSIYLIDYNDPNQIPYNLMSQNQISLNSQYGVNSNNSNNKEYLNYGYNFEQWKVYVGEIKSKFNELNELVKAGKVRLPEPDNELEYLLSFPSDFGGLGDVLNDQHYENVKFFDPKDTRRNNPDKNFMSLIKFDHDQVWFPLEPNPSSLNNNIIDNKYFTNTTVNPIFSLHQPMNIFYPNFYFRGMPNNTITNTIIPAAINNNFSNINSINTSISNSNNKDVSCPDKR